MKVSEKVAGKIRIGNSLKAATAAAENCNENNQISSRIHFKFIINYRGFPLDETTQRRWEIYADLYCDRKCFIQMNHVLVAHSFLNTANLNSQPRIIHFRF